MNSSTKYTFPLFESICVWHGVVKNAEYHSKRFRTSYQKFYWKKPDFDLFEEISIPPQYRKGRVKLRIGYNKNEKTYSFEPYKKRSIHNLKLIFDDILDYDLKFEDRSQLNTLFQKRGNCDDILIVKNGYITDSSYANIVFVDKNHWYTPSTYLLNGTKRTQLLEIGEVKEIPIPLKDIPIFQGFQLINAMLDFEPDFFLPIENIMA